MGIKWRLIGAICGMIPILNLIVLNKIINLTINEVEYEIEKEHLLENNIPITSVSRSSVGKKTYYNLQFDLSKEEYSVSDVSTYKIINLLKIKGVGLVDYQNKNDSYHMVYLVDEKQLNDKYLKNGNLNFTKQNI